MADPVILKTRTVQAFETSAGARIFQIPLEAFPGFWVYSYLVLVDEFRVLIDTGSNVDSSNQGLEAGLQKVSELAGENISLETLTHILITHGHIDHFGGLAYIESRTQAQVGVHELDRRNLNNYEERLRVVAKRLRNFLLESGVSADRAESMYEMYMLPKTLFSSVDVDFTFQAVGMQLGPFEMLHVPGHCAGMVVIRLHDVLFSADHVLASISPHQAPESLTLHTGLSHYLDSLEAVRMWARGVRLTLGGHKAPIIDLSARIDEIKEEHMDRL
ncbi:MAG: MBL fold metallo-hydrolase, partial [Anaerolineae bacterium]|nr:MBL fold metallo-hydrolase [Anaerolineae bacterium]